MIVRILGEGQFDVADASVERLNQLDAALEATIAASDEEGFRVALTSLLSGVREHGAPHEAASLDESDLILPPGDATLDEVRQMLGDDGLIPG